MKAILLNGSPATLSHTGALLAHLSELFLDEGVEAEVAHLSEMSLGINDPEIHKNPMLSKNENVRDLVDAVERADIVVLGTPLYHGSYSGLLKSALDHLVDDALMGKKVGLVSNSSKAPGSTQAAQALVQVALTMDGSVHNRIIGTCKADYELVDGEMKIVNQEILDRCQLFVSELVK